MKLTGRTRYRIEKKAFRKPVLVLQVEETGRVFDYACGFVDSYTSTRWRDAQIEDLDINLQKVPE